MMIDTTEHTHDNQPNFIKLQNAEELKIEDDISTLHEICANLSETCLEKSDEKPTCANNEEAVQTVPQEDMTLEEYIPGASKNKEDCE